MTTHIRLLHRSSDGRYIFDTFAKGREPRYAILSHTWASGKNAEVTYDDMLHDTARDKDGWRKIQFCANQAQTDDLEYFWIDTCCIDRRNLVELQAAINSMYRWYQGAVKCYVYLADVLTQAASGQSVEWQCALCGSRWFTRGWTLQELLAPGVVEFFSHEGVRLGDKTSLQGLIHKTTGIAIEALQGQSLDDFSINERLLWVNTRTTTEEEDLAYCMLGIFGVSLTINYGEGRQEAERRLRDRIKEQKCHLPRETRKYAVPINLVDVPMARHFVDRPEMREIEAALLPDEPGLRRYQHRQKRKVFVLRGMGGIGKTQLAREYADTHRESYSAVLWVDGSSEQTVKQSFSRWAAELPPDQISEATRQFTIGKGGDTDAVVQEVLAWLAQSGNSGWLMVVDNVDREYSANCADVQAYDIKRYFPRAEHGTIVVTTRLAQLEPLGLSHKVKKLSKSMGLAILRSWCDVRDDTEGLDELLDLLDGLPLAIAQAGAYLDQSGVGISKYLTFYRQQWEKLHSIEEVDDTLAQEYPDRTVGTTWTISFEAIRNKSEQTANLLMLWSHINNNDLWYGLFNDMVQYTSVMSTELYTYVGTAATDEMAFVQAMRLLRSYSMIEEVERDGSYSTHAVVHRWAYHHQSAELRAKFRRLCIGVVGWAVPSNSERDYASVQQRLLPHAESCEWDSKDWAVIEDRKSRGAEKSEAVLIEAEEELLQAVFLLGTLYSDQGKLDKAEHIYERAVERYEQALGPNHQSTLDAVNGLAILLVEQGKLDRAEQMYMRALQAKEETLRPDHPSTLRTINNLGILYKEQGRLDAAEEMYMRALRGCEEALGPSHLSTLRTLNNLGILYKHQGKLDAAEQTYTRVLRGYENPLGPSHPSTLQTVDNLGIVYRHQGKLDAAEQMHTRALRGKEEALGPSHPSTLDTVSNIGVLYLEQDKLDEADQMFTRALRGYEMAIGRAQLETYRPALNTLWNTGNLCVTRGQEAKARDCYTQAFSGFSKLCGPSSGECRQLQAALLSLTDDESEQRNVGDTSPVDQDGADVARDEAEERSGQTVSDQPVVSEMPVSRASEKKTTLATRLRRKLGRVF